MKIIGIVILLVLFSANDGYSECSEKFSWLPNNPEDQVIGYRVYYGTSNMGPYPMMKEVAPVQVDGRVYTTVNDLECRVLYYFVCVAYNDLAESDPSLQLSVVAGRGKFPWNLFMPAILNSAVRN